MQETNDFFNDGFGWACRHCDRDLSRNTLPSETHSRLFREGEAESKTPELSTFGLARWADAEHRTLTCQRCGIAERIDIA